MRDGHGDAVSLREGWENKGVAADGQKAVPTNDLVEGGAVVGKNLDLPPVNFRVKPKQFRGQRSEFQNTELTHRGSTHHPKPLTEVPGVRVVPETSGGAGIVIIAVPTAPAQHTRGV